MLAAFTVGIQPEHSLAPKNHGSLVQTADKPGHEAVKWPVPAKNIHGNTPKIGFVSLGCPKALVDSERILTQLRAEGYVVAPDYESADSSTLQSTSHSMRSVKRSNRTAKW